MGAVEARSLTKIYMIDERPVRVVDDVSLLVRRDEFVAVMGSSGSGKSTLLSLLSGLDHPTSGEVLLDGEAITNKTEDELAPIRNALIGFVFQSFHLVPSLTAVENIMFPAELAGRSDARDSAQAILERVGLANRANNFPTQLSGGEQQRVAICRALINRPRILFADEPTGNLDSKNGNAILDLLLQLHSEHDATLILVTHSPDIAARADRVITLEDGRIVTDPSAPPTAEVSLNR